MHRAPIRRTATIGPRVRRVCRVRVGSPATAPPFACSRPSHTRPARLPRMDRLDEVAPAFVEMAHRIVWTTAATVDRNDQPRTRILHPLWEWDGERLSGWIATGPTPVKRADLGHSPHVSLNYWNPEHDTCTADCRATWRLDAETRED